MIINAMTTTHRNEYFRNLLEHQRLTLESVTEQRDRLAEALRELCETLLKDKPRDITELLNKAGEALAAAKGGQP
jgi:predicted transcriptional regulator